MSILPQCRTAAAFFCAAFYGRNDIIHLHDAKVPEIWLNDTDLEKLDVMKELFAPAASLLPGDAFSIGKALIGQGQSFDLVVCDPFTSLMRKILTEEFDTFWDMTRKYFVTGITRDLMTDMQIDPTPAGVSRWMADNGRPNVVAEQLTMRNPDYQGGIYWVTFCKGIA